MCAVWAHTARRCLPRPYQMLPTFAGDEGLAIKSQGPALPDPDASMLSEALVASTAATAATTTTAEAATAATATRPAATTAGAGLILRLIDLQRGVRPCRRR